MFCFDYCDRIEDYLRTLVISVNTFDDIYLTYTSYYNPKLYHIKDIGHVIVIFPNGGIFNCNPRDYPLKIISPLSKVINGNNEQIEPSVAVYEAYWNNHWDKDSLVATAINVDKNCGLWSAYYLWWYENNENNKNEKEPFQYTLYDLENWIKLVCTEYLDKSKKLFIQY